MYFSLLDRITELDASHIVAAKQLQPNEAYLKDHFPGFPVMPGVLMIESAYQACAWLVLFHDEFKTNIARLHDVRNVKFGSFVQPDNTLILTAEILQRDGLRTALQVHGTVEGQTALTGRFFVESEAPSVNSEDKNRHQKQLEENFHHLYDGAQITDPVGSGCG